MDNVSPEAETQITGLLTSLTTVQTNMLTTISTAGIRRVDEVWFFEARSRLLEMKKLGRMYVTQLSIILGVPIYSDVFGSTGYFGDNFFPGNGDPNGFYQLG